MESNWFRKNTEPINLRMILGKIHYFNTLPDSLSFTLRENSKSFFLPGHDEQWAFA